MQLVRYNPNRSLRKHRHHPARLFDGFFDDLFGQVFSDDSLADGASFNNLRVDIYDKENVITIHAELPGVEKEDITVDVKGKLLTLGAERKKDEETEEKNVYRREIQVGKFERTFNLPFDVDAEKVAATYTNGVLQLEIPKPEEQVEKKITIQ